MRILPKPSPNFGKRPGAALIDTIILHYTGMKDMKTALDRLRDPVSEVSCHYLVDEGGEIYQLVDEKHRAWHAGKSIWHGETNLNDRSIGIELVNPGHEFGYRAFPAVQMDGLLELLHDMTQRHAISQNRILAHSDIAPDRKQDPGELFDWRWLAQKGIGVWPDDEKTENNEPTDILLSRFGYATNDIALPVVIAAFQRHFHPEMVTGTDHPETRRRLIRLLNR